MKLSAKLSIILLLAFNLSAIQLFSQNVKVEKSTIIEYYKGKPYYMHFVKKGETIDKIADAYQVTVEEIRRENDFMKGEVAEFQALKIPQNQKNTTSTVDESKETKSVKEKKIVVPDFTKTTVDTIQEFVTYKAKKQDSFDGIARKFNITTESLLKANPDLKRLKRGTIVNIPPSNNWVLKTDDKVVEKPKFQQKDSAIVVVPTIDSLVIQPEIPENCILVQPKQTLFRISNTYNISIDSLIILNPQLENGLKAGMILKIRPDKGSEITPVFEIDKNKDSFVQNLLESEYYNPRNFDNIFKVALLLPFDVENYSASEQETSNPESSFYQFMQFYGGFTLAVDSLVKNGLKIKLFVYDADQQKGTGKIEAILRKDEMKSMDLIVGPLFIHTFSVAAKFAQRYDIPIVNPLSKRENLTNGNSQVIKVQPLYNSIGQVISSYIKNNYSETVNVILVDNNEANYKNCISQITSSANTNSRYYTTTYSVVSYKNGGISGVVSKLKPNIKNLIIYFTNEKENIKEFVSLLYSRKGNYIIDLAGFDGWDKTDINTNFLNDFNYTQFATYYVNHELPEVKHFNNTFKDKFNAFPVDKQLPYLGYDIGMFFLNTLYHLDSKYTDSYSNNYYKGLSTNFYFTKSSPNNGLENYGIKTLKLSNNQLIEK